MSGRPTLAAGDQRYRWRELVAEHPWKKSTTTIRVLLKMDGYADSSGRNAYPGNARLAEELGVSVDSVKRAISAAVSLGFLQVQRPAGGRGRAAIYMVTIPVGAMTHAERKAQAGGLSTAPEPEEKGAQSSAPLSVEKGGTTDGKGVHSSAPPPVHQHLSKGGETQVGISLAAAAPEPPSQQTSDGQIGSDGTDADAPAVLEAEQPAVPTLAELGPEPADHCPLHPVNAEIPCKDCGAARRERKAWHEKREQARIAAADRERAERIRAQEEDAQAAIGCTKCDGTGFDGGWKCDHDPSTPKQSEINRRGVALMRAAVNGKQRKHRTTTV